MESYVYVLVCLVSILSVLTGYFVRQLIANQQIRSAQKAARKLLDDAAVKHKEVLLDAKEEATRLRKAAEAENKEHRLEIQRVENRLTQKEQTLDQKTELVERRDRNLSSKERDIERIKDELQVLKKKEVEQLEALSNVSSEEAKQLLLQTIESEVKDEAARQVRTWENEVREEANRRAQEILATTVQRCTTDVVSEITVSSVPLPSDEMKGRLIGREGRNIRALEQATGVDLIVDDTPEVVTISSFDPVKREVARIALNKLILDGRIHPARIEEVVEKVKVEVEDIIHNAGEQTAYEAGVPGLHLELIKSLGKLKFRTSYGQNVLLHSIEVAHLAGMLANEIGANSAASRKAGLLHDIGKAIDYHVEGPHALIGADLVKQWDKSPEVAQAIAEHHGEALTSSVIGFIVAAADAISGSRPGARRESVEQYLKRVRDLEDIASSFPGIEKTFAIQAGREVRIMVKPEEIDDLTAIRLARDISKKIEESLTYPGQIKVVVVRETTVVDYAK
ncbi:MAG: ribonuclease Y [Dehalococcoidales bacterium]|nr:ribonuclease Y [Dehalococcoidales bacterium]